MNAELDKSLDAQGENKEFYLRKNNEQYGPYSEREVIELLRQQKFTLNNLACIKGMSDWKSLGLIFKERPTSELVRQSIGLEDWEREKAQSYHTQHRYYGVGGWLLLFCVGLTILGPLRNFATIGQTMEAVRLVGGRFPGFATIAYIEIALILVMIAFSLYAGISLWMIRPKAVTIAKFYLGFVVIVSIIDFILVSSIDLPGAAQSEMTRTAVIGVVGSIFYAVIWTAYLNSSQRVQATYYNVSSSITGI